MYKKLYIAFMLINGFSITLQPMEILLRSPAINCQPQYLLASLWHECKPIFYTAMTCVIGGYFLFDFFYKRKVYQVYNENKQLRIEFEALRKDLQEQKEKTSTTGVLAELGRIETKYLNLEAKREEHQSHFKYLWKFLLGSNRIKKYNEIENEDKPYEYCPCIPQLEEYGIRDIIKSVLSLPPEGEHTRITCIPSPRNTGGNFQLSKIIPQPRSVRPQEKPRSKSSSPEVPSPRSGSPSPGSSSPSDSSSDEEEQSLVSKKTRKENADGLSQSGPVSTKKKKAPTPPKASSSPSNSSSSIPKSLPKNIPQKKGDD